MLIHQPTTNHYAILGVSPSAKIGAIKSAYRHLISRYHPDKYRGDPHEALKKSEAINIAFDTLSHSERRQAFDLAHGLTTNPSAALAGDTAADWAKACGCIDSLEPLYQHLSQLSPALAEAFKYTLVSSKHYAAALSIAREHQDRFLATYYGSNPAIHFFALWLFHHQHRAIAQELNHLVSVMGRSIDANSMIRHLVAKHQLPYQLQKPAKRPLHQNRHRGRHSHWGSGLVWVLVSLLLLAAATLVSGHRI